jgi:hypothetical protein
LLRVHRVDAGSKPLLSADDFYSPIRNFRR